MNILVIINNRFFDQCLAREVARLATNTWANITLLGTHSGFKGKKIGNVQQNLLNYRQVILDSFSAKSYIPYDKKKISAWRKTSNGSLLASPVSSQKRLELMLIEDDLIWEIHLFSKRQALDLLVLGGDMSLNPLLVAAAIDAASSVLMVKGATDPKQIVCCLSNVHVTQNSLEMINQLATLYNAELKIVGFSNGEDERLPIELQLKQLLHYYNNLKLTPWLEMVDVSIMTQYIFQELKKNLVAVWVEKDPLGSCLFPQDKLTSLINNSSSSLLLLH